MPEPKKPASPPKPPAMPKGKRQPRGKPFEPGDSRLSVETRFKPGESGNPKGSSTWVRFRALLKEVGLEAGAKGKTRYRELAETLFKLAEKGNLAAIKEVLDRVEGKAPQPIVGEDLGPIQAEHKHDFSKLDRKELSDLVALLRKAIPLEAA